jgi:hypothetical protein
MPKLKFRTLRCIKPVKLKLPHNATTRTFDEETGKAKVSHYFEGSAQIGRIMVGYLVEKVGSGALVTASYAFGRLSDKRASKKLGRHIVSERYKLGHIHSATLPELTAIGVENVLIAGARTIALLTNVTWITDKVTIL